MSHTPDTAACEARLAHTFKKPELLIHALTHSSVKSADRPSNERMEFLGDAILGQEISLYLFAKYEDFQEGELTKVKSVVVSRAILAKVFRAMSMEEFIILGKGITRANLPTSLLANVFEAVVAAIYMDQGVRAVRKFIRRALVPEIDLVINNGHRKNYKSLLQHYAQKHHKVTPEYALLSEDGPDHNKVFLVQVMIAGDPHGEGRGSSKKEAEQNAARASLLALREPAVADAPELDTPFGIDEEE